VADWATISSLATAGGTLALAGVTLASVRSANRAARVAERSLLAGLRPVLVPARYDDPPQKINFGEGEMLKVPGGSAALEVSPDAILMAMPVRNAGSGIAILHGWQLYSERLTGAEPPTALDEFHRLTRDLYVPVSDVGFWQGTFRDPSAEEFAAARAAIEARVPVTLDVLYGDHEGAQRVITRFGFWPRDDDGLWLAAAARHWNVDRPDPR
jgi:hypothetical protein